MTQQKVLPEYWGLVEFSADAIVIVNQDGEIILENAQAAAIFGYQRAELPGQGLEVLLPERYRHKHRNHLAGYFENPRMRAMGISLELYGLRKDGREFPAEISLLPLQSEKGVLVAGIIRDITPRKQAEEALRRLVAQQVALANIAKLALSSIDSLRLMNETAALVAKAFKVEHGEVLELLPGGRAFLLRAGVGWKEGYVGQAIVRVGMNSQAGYTLQSHEPVILEDLRTETRFSRPQLLLDHDVISGMSVLISGQLRVFGVLGVHTTRRRTFRKEEIQFLQVTADMLAAAIERRNTEADTQLRKARFQQLFENAPLGIAMLDENERITRTNKAFESIFQFPIEEIRGHPINEIIVPENLAEEASALASGVFQGRTTESETSRRRKDGTLACVRTIGVPIILDQKPVGVYAIYEDLTEHRALEEKFRHSQKMEAIGRLAGGVAHDFNNLLSIIMGQSELLMNRQYAPDSLHRKLEEIHGAGERASRLTSQLLAFSRKQVLRLQIIDLNAVLANLENMLRRLIGEHIELLLKLDAGLGLVKTDPGQIEQVLMNLSVNARDAMPKGGKLTITTCGVLLDEHAQLHTKVVPGPYVMLAVSDTGCGMDMETQTQIFEPFFTTKGKGKGTGLGLSTTYGIVKQSGGHIWVYSELGLGTTFKVYLPQVEENAAEAKSDRLVEKPYHGSETILVVEDEDGVRDLACEFLSKYGYKTLRAKAGTEAIRLAEAHRGVIHLLVTDVVMPGMNGREVVNRVTTLRPEIKVLYMSGYTDDVMDQGMVEMDKPFLQKPFSMTSLLRNVRQALSGSGTDSPFT